MKIIERIERTIEEKIGSHVRIEDKIGSHDKIKDKIGSHDKIEEKTLIDLLIEDKIGIEEIQIDDKQSMKLSNYCYDIKTSLYL